MGRKIKRKIKMNKISKSKSKSKLVDKLNGGETKVNDKEFIEDYKKRIGIVEDGTDEDRVVADIEKEELMGLYVDSIGEIGNWFTEESGRPKCFHMDRSNGSCNLIKRDKYKRSECLGGCRFRCRSALEMDIRLNSIYRYCKKKYETCTPGDKHNHKINLDRAWDELMLFRRTSNKWIVEEREELEQIAKRDKDLKYEGWESVYWGSLKKKTGGKLKGGGSEGSRRVNKPTDNRVMETKMTDKDKREYREALEDWEEKYGKLDRLRRR